MPTADQARAFRLTRSIRQTPYSALMVPASHRSTMRDHISSGRFEIGGMVEALSFGWLEPAAFNRFYQDFLLYEEEPNQIVANQLVFGRNGWQCVQ